MRDTVASFKAILNGEVDDIPETFFFLQGDLDAVKHSYSEAKK